MADHTETIIDGLAITFNRFIEDSRGYLAELLPNGTDNPLAKEGIKNIYLSSATGEAPRAGHYHHRQTENFFVIQGTALWAFHDYREGSVSKGKTIAVILTSEKKVSLDSTLPIYSRGRLGMPGITVPVGVYHVYWPIGASGVSVLCVASTPYDPSDYVNIQPRDVPGIQELTNVIVKY